MRAILSLIFVVVAASLQAQYISPVVPYPHTIFIDSGNLVVQDGTEGLGKFLKDIDGDGLASWSDLPLAGIDTIIAVGDGLGVVYCIDEVCDTVVIPPLHLAVNDQRLTGNRKINLMGYALVDSIDAEWNVSRDQDLTGAGKGGWRVAFNDGSSRLEFGAGELSGDGLPRTLERIITGTDTFLTSIDIERRVISTGYEGATNLLGIGIFDSIIDIRSRSRDNTTTNKGVLIGRFPVFNTSGSDVVDHSLLFTASITQRSGFEAFPDSLLMKSSANFYKMWPLPPSSTTTTSFAAFDDKGKIFRTVEDGVLPLVDGVPDGSTLSNSQIFITVNEAVDSLLFTVKYSDGTVKVAALLLQ